MMNQNRIRLPVLSALAAALAACSGPVENRARYDAAQTTGSVRYGAIRSVDTDSAFVRLPAGTGPVSQVRELEFVDGVGQQMLLGVSEGAENRFDIALRTNVPRQASGPTIPMGKPTQEGIRLELSERFPNVSMQVVARPMRNAYGQYGLAMGRGAGGMRCIYAWQWIDDVGDLRTSRAGLFLKLGAVAGTAGASASLRFRVCRSGVTIDQLAGSMNGIVLSRTAKETANESLVQREVAVNRSLERDLTGADTPAPAVREKPPARRRVVTRPVAEQPPQAPRDAPVPRAREIPAPAPTPMAPPAEPGVRYLAPVAPGGAPSSAPPSAPAAPRIPVPQAQPRVIVPSPVAARQTLDPSLPAAAYAGPGRTSQ